MKDGKPEIVAWLCEYEGMNGDRSFTAHTSEKTVRRVPPDFGEPGPLIRLSDHEAVVEHLRATLRLVQSRISICLNDDAPMGAGTLGRIEQEIEAALSK